MAEIKVGDIIPLIIQLHDGYAGADVRARVYNSLGLNVANLKLVHYENGLYMNKSFEMPNDEFVTVQYQVQDSLDYAMGSETFYSIQKPSPEPTIIVGEVVEKMKNESIIIGEVVNGKKAFANTERI